MVDIDGQLAR
jgi:hypothetical protein